jgi:hypothetical protein
LDKKIIVSSLSTNHKFHFPVIFIRTSKKNGLPKTQIASYVKMQVDTSQIQAIMGLISLRAKTLWRKFYDLIDLN